MKTGNIFRVGPRVVLLAAMGAITLSSCEKYLTLDYCTNPTIGINVKQSHNPYDSRHTSMSTRSFMAGDDLLLVESVSCIPSDMALSTRGATVTTAGIQQTGKSFSIEGWLGPEDTESSNRHFFSNRPEYDGTSWILQNDTVWQSGIPATFWSYYLPEGCPTPSFSWPGDTPSSDQLSNLSFTFGLPSPTADSTDAASLKDFVVAYNRETRNISASGAVSVIDGTGSVQPNGIDISFCHPLAAIRFTAGNINGSSDPTNSEYVDITGIELTGVASRGAFVATGSGGDTCTFACTPSDTVTYSQITTRSQIAAGQYCNAGSEYIFFMIPQNLEHVKVRLTISKRKKTISYGADGNPVDSTYSAPQTSVREVSLSGSWESGKYYTYKLSPRIFFGGEVLTMKKDELEVSDTSNIKLTENGLEFYVDGRSSLNEWIAPLPVTGINIVKLSFTHTYTNNSQGSFRRIWLENAIPNPAYTEGGSEPRYISDGMTTPDATLVAEAVALGYSNFWPDNHYTGYLGETTQDKKKWSATAYDRHMNDSGDFTDVTSTQFFYLGGRFSFIRVHFDYVGDTGHGAGKWTARYPTFNIVETVE